MGKEWIRRDIDGGATPSTSACVRHALKASTPLRLVLDTNVWLDWLLFADAAVQALRDAVTRDAARVFISPACEAELARVLTYPLGKFTLEAAAQAAALAQCRAVAHTITDPAAAHAIARLPDCADPDDQKFLELARDCGADWLITKDRALLALAQRKARPLPFCIATPGQFTRRALHSGIA